MCHDQGINKIYLPEIYTQIYNCSLNSLLFTEKLCAKRYFLIIKENYLCRIYWKK